jgi:hypothetical protein
MRKHVMICIVAFLYIIYACVLLKHGFSPLDVAALTSSAFLAFTIGFIMGYWS